jgi:lysophospholipase L1-like esterase
VHRRWLLGGLLIVGGVGLVAVATRRPKVTEKTRLLLIGDSLAVGLNTHMREMATDEGLDAYAGKGIVGSRIDQWAHDPWLDEELVAFLPNLILVSLGTNDEALGPGADAHQAAALETLMEKLRATGAEIVWIGPPSLPFPRAGVSDMIRNEAPYYFASETLDIPRGPDGLHPTAAGYAGWAGAIWRWLS